MLVLTRKIGQQIVLPECGVTIEVLNVGGNRVRLGIAAPADIPVHRSEIRDRIHRQRENRQEGSAPWKNQTTALAGGLESSSTARASPPDLDRCLAEWIGRRTNGRIRRLSVKTVGDRMVISGSAASYYALQLAQAAVSEVLDTWNSPPPPNVEYEIDIGR
jgi:carbon storage regulator